MPEEFGSMSNGHVARLSAARHCGLPELFQICLISAVSYRGGLELMI